MNSGALKRTLVADLQYDPKFSDCKEKLFPIISRSTINCVPQWKFATRSNQHWENVEIRVPIPLMTKATELKDKIDRLVYYVYEEDDEYAIQDVELRPQIIYSDIEPEVSNDVEFDRIQDVLIQGIRDAKYLIWVRFLYKGIIIKHNKTEPTYTKTSLFLCEKRRFFMARTEKGVVATI